MLSSMDRGEPTPFILEGFAILLDLANGRECLVTDQLKSGSDRSSECVSGNRLFHDVSFLDHVESIAHVAADCNSYFAFYCIFFYFRQKCCINVTPGGRRKSLILNGYLVHFFFKLCALFA